MKFAPCSIWTATAMRLLSIRLIISLIVGITLVSLSSSYYEAVGKKRGLRRDLESLAGNVETGLEKDSLHLNSTLAHSWPVPKSVEFNKGQISIDCNR
jgi:hypothetical protein